MRTLHYIILTASFLVVACDGQKLLETTPNSDEYPSTEEEAKPWPATLDAAVQRMLAQLSDEDKDLIQDTAKTDLSQFHQKWGRGIRNDFGLFQGNDTLRKAACAFDANEYRPIKIASKETLQTQGRGCHPDEASIIIIGKVWEALQK